MHGVATGDNTVKSRRGSDHGNQPTKTNTKLFEALLRGSTSEESGPKAAFAAATWHHVWQR